MEDFNYMQAWEDGTMYTDEFSDYLNDVYEQIKVFEKTSKNTKLTSNEYNETKKARDTQRKKERSMKRNWEGV